MFVETAKPTSTTLQKRSSAESKFCLLQPLPHSFQDQIWFRSKERLELYVQGQKTAIAGVHARSPAARSTGAFAGRDPFSYSSPEVSE